MHGSGESAWHEMRLKLISIRGGIWPRQRPGDCGEGASSLESLKYVFVLAAKPLKIREPVMYAFLLSNELVRRARGNIVLTLAKAS